MALETERLRLRPLELADAPRIQALFPDPEVMRYLADTIPWPYPPEGAETFVRRTLPLVAEGREYAWAILLKGYEEQGLVGLITLTPESDEDHRGFWLAREHWGRGLMSEAVAAVTDFAFDALAMESLLLNNAAPNRASHRLKERAGAEIVGVEEAGFVGGRLPRVRWRLTAEAWRSR